MVARCHFVAQLRHAAVQLHHALAYPFFHFTARAHARCCQHFLQALGLDVFVAHAFFFQIARTLLNFLVRRPHNQLFGAGGAGFRRSFLLFIGGLRFGFETGLSVFAGFEAV